MGLFDRLFGSQAAKPPPAVAVVGLQDRRADVEAFCLAVCAAQTSRRPCGVRLRREPDDAIAVDGFVGAQSWHVGYLDRDTAAKVNRALIRNGIAADAALRSIRIGHRSSIAIRLVIAARRMTGAEIAHG